MGRTFLDIDMARAADLLGMERRQAEAIRDLGRGTFLGLGPAIARRPVTVRIGAVETSARSSSPSLTPLPKAPSADMKEFLLTDPVEPLLPLAPSEKEPIPAAELLGDLAKPVPQAPFADERDPIDLSALVIDVLRAISADPDAAGRSAPILYQDFQMRCRIAGARQAPLDAPGFARRLAAARAGIFDGLDAEWSQALKAAAEVPDDMLGAFLLIARAAREGTACPDDNEIARVYGTSSLGRARRIVSYMEERDIIVARVDLSGKRSFTIPRLGWTTQPVEG